MGVLNSRTARQNIVRNWHFLKFSFSCEVGGTRSHKEVLWALGMKQRTACVTTDGQSGSSNMFTKLRTERNVSFSGVLALSNNSTVGLISFPSLLWSLAGYRFTKITTLQSSSPRPLLLHLRVLTGWRVFGEVKFFALTNITKLRYVFIARLCLNIYTVPPLRFKPNRCLNWNLYSTCHCDSKNYFVGSTAPLYPTVQCLRKVSRSNTARFSDCFHQPRSAQTITPTPYGNMAKSHWDLETTTTVWDSLCWPEKISYIKPISSCLAPCSSFWKGVEHLYDPQFD